MGEYEDVQVETKGGLEERYNALYEPAAASRRVVEYMVEHPFADRTVFKAATNLESYINTYPELVQLGAILLDTRTRVESAYREIQGQTGGSNRKIAEVLFEVAQRKEKHRPEGKLVMSYLDNPFALVLVAEGKDFERLDSRDVAGHYNSALKVRVAALDLKVPFIAIKKGSGLSQEEIFEHERNHAFNDKIKQALKRADKPHLWGEQLNYGSEALKVAGNLHKAWELNGDLKSEAMLRSDPSWRQTMGHSLNKAKDEIIVSLMTGESMEFLYERGGYYDYFSRDFDMQGTTEVENLLWNSYLKIIKSEIHIARMTQGLYKSLELQEKADNLPWMLMRIPLGNWKNELNVSGVTSETEIIGKIIKRRSEISRSVFGRLRKLTKPLKVPVEDTTLKDIQSSQDKLLIPELLEYWQNQARS